MDELKKEMELRVMYMHELEKVKKDMSIEMKTIAKDSKLYNLLSFEVNREYIICNSKAEELFRQFLIEEANVKNLVSLIARRDDLIILLSQ